MKRIRNEEIIAVVSQYLKRRHFSENVDSSPSKAPAVPKSWTQTAREMALQTAVETEGLLSNAIAFSSISGDVTACDQQYTRFKAFLQDAVEPYRTELQSLLFPLFVHVYMELLGNGQKTPAQKFFSRHAGMFAEDPDQYEVLETLQRMTSRDDLLIHDTTCQFKENKSVLLISEDVLQYLLTYLKNEDNILMLQIFNNHFELQVHAMSNTEESESIAEMNYPPMSSPKLPEIEEKKPPPCEVSLTTLQECTKKVQDGPPCPTSICFYSFLNAYQGLSSVAISPHQTLICGGFEDSSVQVWSLTPRLLPIEPCDVNITRINMAGDFKEDIKERQKRPSESESVVMRGHSGAVYSTAFTTDTRYLLSASEDTTVRLWDLKTWTNKAIYRGHNYPVWGIDTSVDGFFASCSHDRTAKLWCTDRTFPLRSFVGHMQDVDCVKFHPNSNYIATGSSDKTVRLWSLQDGRPVRLFQGHKANVFSLTFSPDGKYLASSGEDRNVKVWDLSSGMLLKDLRGHSDTVFSLSFNTDSTMIASGGLDYTLRIWDLTKGATKSSTDSQTSPEQLASFPAKSTTINYLHYTKCNLLYAAGSVAT